MMETFTTVHGLQGLILAVGIYLAITAFCDSQKCNLKQMFLSFLSTYCAEYRKGYEDGKKMKRWD